VVEGRNLISFGAVRGYGMNLSQVSKILKVSKQSVLRGVERGAEGFQQRGWSLGGFQQ
jgi:transposase